ncbi:hypothetical protein BDZ85DRAFT_268374 [Elsinoe ampelina]|uniref:Uncharacterized protein n=1 Tax=Elsinoe ampelina TaxID=302913 RepID=A0A6A6G284_9PEZI|nr:hypothetical protein BDZ85DRAFT_268374 [Elsinoe ampelina]
MGRSSAVLLGQSHTRPPVPLPACPCISPCWYRQLRLLVLLGLPPESLVAVLASRTQCCSHLRHGCGIEDSVLAMLEVLILYLLEHSVFFLLRSLLLQDRTSRLLS